MTLEAIHCPVCGPGTSRRVMHIRDHNLLLPGEFELRRCRSCGLGFLSPRPDAESIAEFYPDRYWRTPPEEDAQPEVDRVMRHTIEAIERDYPGGRVLDVGCGIGGMAALMRERGLDAVGLDPYEHACQMARERYGLEVEHALLRDTAHPDASFDAITLFDVLEHVHDPLADLAKAHALLKPGGAVYIKVPNYGALQRVVCGRYWALLDPPRHLFHYSPRSLPRLISAAGFATAQASAIPDLGGAAVFETSMLYMLRALLWRLRGMDVSLDRDQPTVEALEGNVYPGVPSAGKRLFRWGLRNILYAPLAIENLINRSVVLLGVGKRR